MQAHTIIEHFDQEPKCALQKNVIWVWGGLTQYAIFYLLCVTFKSSDYKNGWGQFEATGVMGSTQANYIIAGSGSLSTNPLGAKH